MYVPPIFQKILLYVGVAAALLATGYVKGCSDERDARVLLEARIEAMTEAEEKRQEEEIAARQRITNAREAEHALLAAIHRDELARVRAAARRSVVPPAPEGTKRPDLACFDRAELDAALGAYRRGVAELVGEGAACAVDLNTARRWWQEQSILAPPK
jgi:hypothetical protein